MSAGVIPSRLRKRPAGASRAFCAADGRRSEGRGRRLAVLFLVLNLKLLILKFVIFFNDGQIIIILVIVEIVLVILEVVIEILVKVVLVLVLVGNDIIVLEVIFVLVVILIVLEVVFVLVVFVLLVFILEVLLVVILVLVAGGGFGDGCGFRFHGRAFGLCSLEAEFDDCSTFRTDRRMLAKIIKPGPAVRAQMLSAKVGVCQG